LQYFGKDDIKINVNAGNKFELQRSLLPAKNLSEGEKTAIAFAYFIVSLEEKGRHLSDTIVYIDDPISSLDSNHLFNTYSLIRDKFYYFDANDLHDKHKCRAKQFFISTHNFEFLYLIKEWFRRMKDRDISMYLVERSSNGTEKFSAITELPLELFKFQSEYVYLFSIIYSFQSNPTTDFANLYSMPNILRRFLETFCAFKYLSASTVDENLGRLIFDAVKCERVRKFVNYYSHSLNTTKLLQFSDPAECIEVVSVILDSIKKVDEDHYNSLVGALNLQAAGQVEAVNA